MAVDWHGIEEWEIDRDRAMVRAGDLLGEMPDVMDAGMVVDLLESEFVGSAFSPGGCPEFVDRVYRMAADR